MDDWEPHIAATLKRLPEPEGCATGRNDELAMAAGNRLYVLTGDTDDRGDLGAVRIRQLNLSVELLEVCATDLYPNGSRAGRVWQWTINAAGLDHPIEFEVSDVDDDALELWHCLTAPLRPT